MTPVVLIVFHFALMHHCVSVLPVYLIKSFNTYLCNEYSATSAAAANFKYIAEPLHNSEPPAAPAARYTGSTQVGGSALNNHIAGLRRLVCVDF